jgi:hypothetical protein
VTDSSFETFLREKHHMLFKRRAMPFYSKYARFDRDRYRPVCK